MKNKHLLAVMALTLCCAFAATAYANWSLPLWADINNDGDVNVADALGVVAVILELDNAPTPEAVGVEVVVEACPVDQYRATPDGDCQAVVAPTTCTAPALLNTTTNACVTPTTCTSPALLNTATNVCVTPEAACPVGQYRATDGGDCEDVPVAAPTINCFQSGFCHTAGEMGAPFDTSRVGPASASDCEEDGVNQQSWSSGWRFAIEWAANSRILFCS